MNNAQVGMQSNINNVNAQTAAGNQQNAANTVGGVGNMLSNVPVIGSLFAKGGEVPAMANGGIAPSPLQGTPAPQDQWMAPVFNQSQASSGPSVPGAASVAPLKAEDAFGGQHQDAAPVVAENAGQGPTVAAASKIGEGIPYASAALLYSGGRTAKGPHRSHVANFLAGGGQVGEVKAIVSPKEVYLGPEQVHKVLHEGADPMKVGHHFPGTDKVKGRDSKKNDVIPTTLRAGGVVIPVHITTHKEASERGRRFVARTMAKHMKRPAGAK